MLVEAYGNNVLSETTCRDWFRRFNDDNFDWVTRSLKIGPGRLKTVNCRFFWTRTISNRKKCLPSNWVFLKQSFPCGYMPWRRFKRSENVCRMNWTIGRWSDAKTHVKFCLPDKKERHSCIGLWQAMKSESIFRILNQSKKSWIDSAQPSTSSSRPNRFERKTMLCVWWDQEGVIYKLLCKTWWNS